MSEIKQNNAKHNSSVDNELIVKIEQLANSEDMFLIKEMSLLKNFLRIVLSSEKNIKSQEELQKLSKSLIEYFRGSLFSGGVETLDKKISKTFKELANHIYQNTKDSEKHEEYRYNEIRNRHLKVISSASYFEKELRKLLAKRGVIEKLLSSFVNDTSKLKDIENLVRTAIQDCEKFYDLVADIIKASEEIQKLPGTTDVFYKGYKVIFKTTSVRGDYVDVSPVYMSEDTKGRRTEKVMGRCSASPSKLNTSKWPNITKEYETFVNMLRKKTNYTGEVRIFQVHSDDIFEEDDEQHLKGLGIGKRLYSLLAMEVSARFKGILMSGHYGSIASHGRSQDADKLWNSDNWPSHFLKIGKGNFLAYIPGFK